MNTNSLVGNTDSTVPNNITPYFDEVNYNGDHEFPSNETLTESSVHFGKSNY